MYTDRGNRIGRIIILYVLIRYRTDYSVYTRARPAKAWAL